MPGEQLPEREEEEETKRKKEKKDFSFLSFKINTHPDTTEPIESLITIKGLVVHPFQWQPLLQIPQPR